MYTLSSKNFNMCAKKRLPEVSAGEFSTKKQRISIKSIDHGIERLTISPNFRKEDETQSRNTVHQNYIPQNDLFNSRDHQLISYPNSQSHPDQTLYNDLNISQVDNLSIPSLPDSSRFSFNDQKKYNQNEKVDCLKHKKSSFQKEIIPEHPESIHFHPSLLTNMIPTSVGSNDISFFHENISKSNSGALVLYKKPIIESILNHQPDTISDIPAESTKSPDSYTEYVYSDDAMDIDD
ncbi:hypothetical protein AYI70_g9194 [Smittium culicis]|uniref:Uncharacterized protein n=2 Tax=Smittium culicis TaxID=133412 RepID=A0A1R1XCK2_9FUNG|nr:hypothetical protein AYI70_g9194 [Smittium culicis]